MSSNEVLQYCNGSVISPVLHSVPQIASRVNFTSDFMIRAYTSGCYYYDVDTGKWSSQGMEIYSDTNLMQTHCMSYHLTSFAGGLVVLPNAINFDYVWSHASFLQNPTIYSTIIGITCLYVIIAVWARLMDMRDRKKLSIIPMSDNAHKDNYFYEIIVFTGGRNEAATHSKVGHISETAYYILEYHIILSLTKKKRIG